jgi:hypothetical protein
MNKKKLIQLVVILACFGGSGFVLYNGLVKKSPSSAVPVVLPTGNTDAFNQTAQALSGTATEKLLPYGNSLDFTKVFSKINLKFGLTIYPKLDPNSEVGVPENQLIKPEPKTK